MPAALTMDEAVALLAERVAKGGGKKSKKAKAAPKPKTAKATAAKSSKSGCEYIVFSTVEIGEAGNCDAS